MKMRIRLSLAIILIVLLAGMARGQSMVDSTLQAIESLYTAGQYSQAELGARRLLETEMLSDSVIMVAEQWVAFALVAQGQTGPAREHFGKILRKRPTYELDPLLTSPKILAVFNEAKAGFRAPQIGLNNPQTVPEVTIPTGITFRTILFPGWEQLYHRRTVTGAIFMGAGVATLGAGITLDLLRRSARDAYLGETLPDEIESKYQTYNRRSKAEGWAFAAFAAVYLVSEIDVFMNDSPVIVSSLPADPGKPGSGFLLSLSFR
jgi:hypothetical protein